MAFSFDEYTDAVAVTPSDSADNSFRALYIGGTGDVAVITEGNLAAAAVTFKAVPVGTVLRIHVTKVMSTNTTATNIVGFRAG